MEHGVNSALVSDLGRVMGPKAACPAEVFCAAQLKVGGAAVEGCCPPAKSWPAAQRRLATGDGSPPTAAKDTWPAAHPSY
jgi:hypothetical protein